MAKRQGRKKKPASAARIGEFATSERCRKMGGVITEIISRDTTGRATIKRHQAQIECMLDAYLLHADINTQQHAAGMKFRRKFLCISNGGGSSDNMEFINSGSSNAESRLVTYLDRKGQLDKIRALLTRSQRSIVENVCVCDKFTHSAKEMAILVQALDILASHWGFSCPTPKGAL